MSRAVEVLLRAEGTGALTAEQAAQLAALKATPQWAETIQSVARNYMEDLPGMSSTAITAKEAFKAAQEKAAQDAMKRAAEIASPREAARQLGARWKRYAPPLAGSAIGTMVGGPVGGAVGALAGAGTRPARQALARMMRHPAVQTAAWSPVQGAAQAAMRPGVARAQQLLLSRAVPAMMSSAVGLDPEVEALLAALRKE